MAAVEDISTAIEIKVWWKRDKDDLFDQQNNLAFISSREHAFQLSFTYKITLKLLLYFNISQSSVMVTVCLAIGYF